MKEFELDVRGQPLKVKEDGSGQPLLFLHGAGGSAWNPLLKRLAERHRVIAPEHPGFGRSQIPDWMMSVGDLAFFYLDALEVMDLKGVHLAGHSLGGWTAAEIALGSERSQTRPKARTLSEATSATISLSPASSTSNRNKSAPSRARARAIALPMPEAAPVTRACFPRIDFIKDAPVDWRTLSAFVKRDVHFRSMQEHWEGIKGQGATGSVSARVFARDS